MGVRARRPNAHALRRLARGKQFRSDDEYTTSLRWEGDICCEVENSDQNVVRATTTTTERTDENRNLGEAFIRKEEEVVKLKSHHREIIPLLKKRRRITRRFASPGGLFPDPLLCHASPWTTKVDGDISVPQCQQDNGSKDALQSLGKESNSFTDDSTKCKKKINCTNKKQTPTDTSHIIGVVNHNENEALPKVSLGGMEPLTDTMCFDWFRCNYLIVHVAIMLADGLQGTHLYVLYEGYGYSVASLYCLGFVSGALTSPFIGPFVDKMGRKNSAILYCALEIIINLLEQFPNLSGLIISRIVGGITTNLLFSVFESWLVTEHRRRGYAEDGLETILRDSVILSNLAAIASGWLAHTLATNFGAVGPFEGAVTCTAVALFLVMTMWTENYGGTSSGVESVMGYLNSAFRTIVTDSKICRIGLIQGLTEGALQTFVFLWSPALRRFSTAAPSNNIGLDENGEPAYGLIFGAFMACGVLGGLSEPFVRKVVTTTFVITPPPPTTKIRNSLKGDNNDVIEIDGEGEVRPMTVEFIAAICYICSAGLLATPFLLPLDNPFSFSVALASFLLYEFLVGLYMPCEGVIRSIYMPTSSMCSLMTMLRVIVNVAVAFGVISTNYVPFTMAFGAVSTLMVIAAIIQLSMWRV